MLGERQRHQRIDVYAIVQVEDRRIVRPQPAPHDAEHRGAIFWILHPLSTFHQSRDEALHRIAIAVAKRAASDIGTANASNPKFDGICQHVIGHTGALESLDGAHDAAEYSRPERRHSLVSPADDLHVFDVVWPKTKLLQDAPRRVVARPTYAVDAEPFPFEVGDGFDAWLNDKFIWRRFAAGDDYQIRARCVGLRRGFGRARKNRNLAGQQRRYTLGRGGHEDKFGLQTVARKKFHVVRSPE